MKILIAQILYISLLVKQMAKLKKKMEINTYLLLLQIKTNKYYKSIQNFGIELNIPLKK